jgi:hypothetical protein
MKNIISILFLSFLVVFVSSCKEDEVPDVTPEIVNTIPEFFPEGDADSYGIDPPAFTILANSSDRISKPQDLDFIKTRNNELWVLNKGAISTGASTVTFTEAGTDNMNGEYRRDQNARHFMSQASALSFSDNGNWATSPNIMDANFNNGSFTGPTLWSSEMSIYAKPSGGNGSHLDMLHSSPFSMGIENEKDNVFWLFDGFNKHLVRYDFGNDHGAGNTFHDDGIVQRYMEIELKRDPDVPSHLVLDVDKKWLYVVDGGNKRVLRININSGSKLRDLNLFNEQLAEHSEYSGVEWEVVVAASAGLKRPCGVEVIGNRLFVSDYETGDIICYDVNSKNELGRANSGDAGITGIKLGPDNRLWYVNAITNEMGRVDPR